MSDDVDLPERGYLDRAIALAQRGWGRVHKNPMVGCVLVRDGEVVGEGWHGEFGGPHAERVALDRAGSRARGATAFVSLEPCAHVGKTGRCTEALARAGVVRVVYAAADPGAGAGGHDHLRALGVQTRGPVHSQREARVTNQGFFRRALGERPYVLLKMAVTLDGRVSAGPGQATRITGGAADQEVHRLRAGFEAIMVGAGTVLVDDPLLTARPAELEPFAQPLRVVLDGRLRTPPTARLFDEAGAGGAVHLFCGPEATKARAEALEARGASVHRVAVENGRLALVEVLDRLRDLDVGSVFLEGGPRLADSFLEAGLVDRLTLFVAPRVVGSRGVPAFQRPLSPEGWKPAAPPRTFGDDVCVILDPSV